eukprot:gene19980-26691_t
MSDPNGENDEMDDEFGQEEEGLEPSLYNIKAIAFSTKKVLTSKFRGVCWNKKNKRWQAAINSNGRYLYLGSYDAQEEAARVFDKAAVRVRGPKARINYNVQDYLDAQGQVLPDALVESLLLTACNPTKQRRQRSKQGDLPASDDPAGITGTDKGTAEIALQALARFIHPSVQDTGRRKDSPGQTQIVRPPSVGLPQAVPLMHSHANQLPSSLQPVHQARVLQLQNPMAHQPNSQNPLLILQQPMHLMHSMSQPQQQLQPQVLPTFQPHLGLDRQQAQQPASRSGQADAPSAPSTSTIFSSIQSNLPVGATIDSVIPSDGPDVVGALYKQDHQSGACIWNGKTLHNLGLYGSDKDAKQACLGALTLFAKLSIPQPEANVNSGSAAPASADQQIKQAPLALFQRQDHALQDPQAGQPRLWPLPHASQLTSLPQQQQHLELGSLDIAGGQCSRPLQSYHLQNADNVFPQLAGYPQLRTGVGLGEAGVPTSGMEGNSIGQQNVKLEPVFLSSAARPNVGAAWQLHVSQPDPVASVGYLSSSNQEITGETVGGRLLGGKEGDGELRGAGHWAMQGVQTEFASLRQLANIDVNEALQLFIASKKNINQKK